MVQFFDPTQEAQIKRRRRTAEMLQKQGAPKQTEMVSGFAVPQSGLEQLARGLSGGLGAYQDARADTQEQELVKSRQAMMAKAIEKMGTDPKAAAAIMMQDPSMMAQGLGVYGEAMKNDRAIIEADTEYRRKRQLAAEAAKEARLTAGIKEGNLSVDASGNIIPPVGGGSQQKAMDVKNSAYEVASRLLENSSGVKANRGGISTLLPNVRDSSVNAAADLETLASLLTTENLGLLKGVLSDTDMKVLKDIGAGGLKGADEQVLKNLQAIKDNLGGQIGKPTATPSEGDPRIAAAKVAGYSDAEIQQYLKGR